MTSSTTHRAWHTFEIPASVPDAIVEEIATRLHYCGADLEEFRIGSGGRCLEFRPRGNRPAAEVVEVLEGVVECLARSHRPTAKKIHFDRRDRAREDHGDVYAQLVATGEIRPCGEGRVALRGRPRLLLETLDREFLQLATELGAEPHGHPTLLSIDSLRRIDYFGSFPQYLTFVCHLREDLDTLRAFVKRVREGQSLDVDSFEQMAPTEYVLTPSACLPCFERLQDMVLPADGGAPVTTRSHCYRHEAANLKSLERLWEFDMREIIFFGSPERVRQQLADVRRRIEEIVDELGLVGWIESAHDAFFIDDFAKKAAFQSAFDLKQELRLTHRQGSVAAASFNFHNDFFVRGYNVSRSGGGILSSGCVGFGLERFVLAILSQKGLDPQGWPRRLRGDRVSLG